MKARIIETLAPHQVADLLQLYRGEWWSQDRTEADVRRMLGSPAVDFVAALDETDRVVACTRILSDGVYKALLFDVIVDPAWRGTGLGQRIVDAALAHPRVRDVEHVELYCRPEHVEFYARWGFEPASADLRYLRRRRVPRDST